jgi:glycine/D-amino acid oxidase-like deaminating enzyme
VSAPDVVIVGAGMIGAACAYELASAGLDVCVVERGAIASGTTGAGEGNILVSDKEPGPELTLALLSVRRWQELGDELEDDFELEPKGGVVCASSPSGLTALRELAAVQAAAGVEVHDVTGDRLWELEPALTRAMVGGAHYPGDMQVQPMRAAAALLHGARKRGARLLTSTEVLGIRRDAQGAVAAVQTADGEIVTPRVVNAAGAWSAAVAELAGARLPIAPRRGVILVTEPLPPTIIHKVYAAEYVGDVGSGAADLQVSTVVEGTVSGTVLIGASRELVGFEPRIAGEVLRRLAASAVAMFPLLGDVRVMRAYRGFRPFSPDHLPVIGEDPAVPGLWHACGHEGAGIGTAPGTARLVAAALAGTAPPMDAEPFAAGRFAATGVGRAA